MHVERERDFGFVSIKIVAIGQYSNICDVKVKMQTADLHSLFVLRSIFEKIGLNVFVMKRYNIVFLRGI